SGVVRCTEDERHEYTHGNSLCFTARVGVDHREWWVLHEACRIGLWSYTAPLDGSAVGPRSNDPRSNAGAPHSPLQSVVTGRLPGCDRRVGCTCPTQRFGQSWVEAEGERERISDHRNPGACAFLPLPLARRRW